VIFDEFHERSLQADLALALCREVQQGLREDLHILVMSATLDSEPLARLLDNCPVITTTGRSFPIAITHLNDTDQFSIAASTTQAIRRALRETAGDILAFLPGRSEIHRCLGLLSDLSSQIALRPLYGGLAFSDQEAAILPGKLRRVVLATNVAETSLTIEGIETVVDSGWERRPRFDAARGMTSLETVRISMASAEQRAGRAGRLGPGHCYRLWTTGTHGAMLPFSPPEIRQADLAPLAFELAQWGVRDVANLCWLDLPPEGHLTAARRMLTELGAMYENGTLIALGRKMARYPTHPRLSRLLVSATEDARPGLGSDLVALLSEPDLLAASRQTARVTGPSDLLERIEILRRDQSRAGAPARRAAKFWRKLTRAGEEPAPEPETIGRMLANAYPDRVGLQRKAGSSRYLLRNGQGVILAASSVVRDAEWLVAVEINGRSGGEDEIRQASRLDRETIEDLFGSDLEWQRESGWDDNANRVIAREVRRLGAIVLQERPVAVTAQDTLPALTKLIQLQGLEILPWTRDIRQLQARGAFLHKQLAGQDWLDWSDTALLKELGDWLPAWLGSVKNRNDLKRVDLAGAIKARLGWKGLKKLDLLAPAKIEVPSGSHIRLDYTTDESPILAVKLQEMFGLADTPRLVNGRVPVLIQLLSPAARPLAATKDLKSFWNTVYPEIQKEMKGRYPKHPWPDDPWNAKATKKTKNRM
jgi:ATP-dependent helicase HrpB